MKIGTLSMALAAMLATSGIAHAATVSGRAFTTASPCGNQSLASHFHSGTGVGAPVNANRVEVGNFDGADCEEVRGIAEFDLSGVVPASSATLSFGVFDDAGLFPENDFAYLGPLDISAYEGNNVAELADFGSATSGAVGTFSTAGLAVGEMLSFDVTALLNDALGAGASALGIRLQLAGEGNGGAFAFDAFELRTVDGTAPTDPVDPTDPTDPTPVSPVPLPASAILLLGGMAALGQLRRRKTA